MTWDLYIRDANGNRDAQVDEYSQAELIPRFNAIGTWTLDVPPEVGASLLTPRWGVEFVRDGVTVLSGPTRNGSRVFSATENMLKVSGVDDMWWLSARNAHPQPASAAPSGTPPVYGSTEYDVRTDIASTVLTEYVDANCGPTAIAARQVLTLAADPLVGSTITGRARWQNLLAFLQELAVASVPPVGFRVRDLTFEVYAPDDLTNEVTFSVDLGNLAGFTYKYDAPDADFVVVAGEGEGTARAIVEVEDAVVGWGRVETFRDRRDTADVGELTQSGTEELAAKSAKAGVSITPIDGPGRAYLTDYTVGDQVSVVLDDVTVTDIVREVKITLDGNGESVAPAVGSTVEQFAALRLFDNYSRLSKRVRTLETI